MWYKCLWCKICWRLYLWTHLRARYLVWSCIRWFIGTLPDRPRVYTIWSTLEPLERGLAYLSRCNSGWFCHSWISTHTYNEVAKAKLASNKTQVFLAVAKDYKEVEERPQGCWSRIPTLECVWIGLNLIHGPLGQNRVMQHHGLKRTL
jgi:hypothetical protein